MLKKKEVLIIDSTLRDGSHAMHHQFTAKDISEYAKAAEKAGINTLIVGHGNGLGASTLHLGRSLLTDKQMLETAKKSLNKTELGAFLIPGFGTIENDILPALKIGIKQLMVASHCTEANITRQHIQFCNDNKINPTGVLMMAHQISSTNLLYQAKLMESYGAKAILIMDSAGAMLPPEVKSKIKKLANNLKVPVGFHAHNNLGTAVYNSVAALEAGATILDTTSRGLGAGAGNCQLEVVVAVIEKLGYKTNLDLKQLMLNSDNIIKPLMPKPQEIGTVELSSSLAGVFSGFAPHVVKASKQFGISSYDIFVELGKRKVVAGQEDIIVDVANYLKNNAFSS